MEMQDVDMMRKYYSDEAWEAWKHHYKDWPPDEWRALYKDHRGDRLRPEGPRRPRSATDGSRSFRAQVLSRRFAPA